MHTSSFQFMTFGWFKCSIVALWAMLVVGALPQSAVAQAVIRDAEMETLISDMSRKIFQSAGLPSKSVKVVVINKNTFNAFVMDNKHIFINTGVILDSKNPEELVGVIAHETGHMAGGHLARLRDSLKGAQTLSTVGALVGIIGGIAAVNSGHKDAGQIVNTIAGSSQGVARRLVRSHQRQEETAADRAAVTYLEKSNISPKFMLDVFKRLADQGVTLTETESYEASHPMPYERISALSSLVQRSKHRQKRLGKQYSKRFAMVKAKLSAFLLPFRTTFNAYGKDKSLTGRYAMAIATAKHKGYRAAKAMIDRLIKAEPKNPYFWEIKGQFLLESGKASEAIPVLAKARSLSNNNSLISVLYAHALLSRGTQSDYKTARKILERVVRQDKDIPSAYYHLSVAYGRLGFIGDADLALAKMAHVQGDKAKAKAMATRAQRRLQENSKAWLEANDILQSIR